MEAGERNLGGLLEEEGFGEVGAEDGEGKVRGESRGVVFVGVG